MAVPRNHLETLEKALKAAQLKPLSFSLAIAALDGGGKAPTQGVLTLALGSHSLDLQAALGGGILALRSLDGALEGEGAQKRVDAELVGRELRITLGQLPGTVGEGIKSVRMFGRGEAARQFVVEISPRLESMGLKLELMDRVSAAEFDQLIPPETVLSPALALAANRVRGVLAGPEFLPPKVRPWQQLLSTKFSARKLAWAGGAAGALAACVVAAFLFQQWQISGLRSKWKAMEPKVTELQAVQDQIKKYRPWFNRAFPVLSILRRITEAFPEEGYVSAKTLEIRDLSTVTCSGVARDNQAYLALIKQLGAAQEVSGLKTESLRGQAPTQFTFNFDWEGDKARGN
jgi:hypothetical protein